MKERLLVLNDLVKFDKSIDVLEKNIYKLSIWDSEPIIILSIQDLIIVLKKYKEKKISVSELYKWFNLIESRDELQYGNTDDEHESIADIIEYFANININIRNTDELNKYIDFIMGQYGVEK